MMWISRQRLESLERRVKDLESVHKWDGVYITPANPETAYWERKRMSYADAISAICEHLGLEFKENPKPDTFASLQKKPK